MTNFSLHPQLTDCTLDLGRLPLSEARINNDSRFPWIILIPRGEGLVGLHDLATDELASMMLEIRDMSRLLVEAYSPDRINVGALGNLVPQLHVHVIARFETDPAWPGPVWGAGSPVPYDEESPELKKFGRPLKFIHPSNIRSWRRPESRHSKGRLSLPKVRGIFLCRS